MSQDDQRPEEEIDRELEELSSQVGELISTCQARSCYEGFGELRTRAEREGRALFYVHGTFFQMTQAASLLEFSLTSERAIKLISLLQKPEECFKIQPDLPEESFEYLAFELSSCVYENLADAAGQMQGFNSQGLHESIAGGIQVCRNTGKLGCIQCFREYAGDVYLAADDADLARHQCRNVMEHEGPWQSRGNRRWLATMKLGWIEVLQGDFERGLNWTEKALELTDEDEVNVPLHAKFDVLIQLDAIRIAMGMEPLLPNHEIFRRLPAADENPLFQLMRDQNDALLAASNLNYGQAEKILLKWDQELQSRKALHLWFENRLRLIAVKRAAGTGSNIDALSRNLEEKANEADDWLTLRRLNEVLGSDSEPSLLGVRRKDSGRTKSTSGGIESESCETELESECHATDTAADSDVDSEAVIGADSQLAPFGKEAPQMVERLDEIVDKMQTAYQDRSETGLKEVMSDLLGISSNEAATCADTCGTMNLMAMLVSPLFEDQFDTIWKWANQLAAPYRENGVVLSLLATIGNEIRLSGDQPEGGKITPSRLEQLFRKSLELEKNGPQTYARAGSFFLEREDMGEAEKCFARGFRLDRTAPNIALKLAEVYNVTDRPRDALHVLDLCLREGAESDSVAWEAMLSAFHQRKFEAMLNYLNRYEQIAGEVSPINYYRGVAYLELKKPELSLDAIRKEKEFCDPESDFHCAVVEFGAQVDLGNAEEVGGLAEKCVSVSFRGLDYIPMSDMLYLFTKFWNYLGKVKPDSSILEELEDKLLAGGIMPDEYFDQARYTGEPQSEVRYYRVLVNQQLDSDWPEYAGCFPGQEEWKSYFCEWGVLALTEEEARQRVLDMQGKCYPGYAEVVEVIDDEQLFVDEVGVVWQGARYSIPDDLQFDEDEDGDSEDFGLEGFDQSDYDPEDPDNQAPDFSDDDDEPDS